MGDGWRAVIDSRYFALFLMWTSSMGTPAETRSVLAIVCSIARRELYRTDQDALDHQPAIDALHLLDQLEELLQPVD